MVKFTHIEVFKGMVTAAIEETETILEMGLSFCSPRDAYDRKKGNLIALGRFGKKKGYYLYIPKDKLPKLEEGETWTHPRVLDLCIHTLLEQGLKACMEAGVNSGSMPFLPIREGGIGPIPNEKIRKMPSWLVDGKREEIFSNCVVQAIKQNKFVTLSTAPDKSHQGQA